MDVELVLDRSLVAIRWRWLLSNHEGTTEASTPTCPHHIKTPIRAPVQRPGDAKRF
jgi:hypothetical protein